jgi:hypothetical protein
MKRKNLYWALLAIFFVGMALLQVLGARIGMFILFTLFYCLCFYSLMADVALYFRSRKGPFVTGKIENVQEIKDREEGTSYEVEISFSTAHSDERILFKQRFDDTKHEKELVVWVNQSNLLKSVAVCKFDIYWALRTILGLLLVTGISILTGYLILTNYK